MPEDPAPSSETPFTNTSGMQMEVPSSLEGADASKRLLFAELLSLVRSIHHLDLEQSVWVWSTSRAAKSKLTVGTSPSSPAAKHFCSGSVLKLGPFQDRS